MAADLHLAIAHHLLIFILFGILVSELVLVRKGMSNADVKRLASIDIWYGIVAVLILIAGFSRAGLGAKGWAYYSANSFFWAKLGVFVLIGLLSAWPTIKFIGWRKQVQTAGNAPGEAAISSVRRVLWLEAALFALLPAFAAAMARGYGQ
jgi:putative membrane protein